MRTEASRTGVPLGWSDRNLSFVVPQRGGVESLGLVKRNAGGGNRSAVAGDARRHSAVVVDGALRVNRQTGPYAVSVHVRCRRGEETLLESEVEGTASNSAGLCRVIAKAVAAGVGRELRHSPMDARQESVMLAAEASAYLALGEAHHAVTIAEAAYALLPQDGGVALLLLRGIRESIWAHLNQYDPRIVRQDVTIALRGLSL